MAAVIKLGYREASRYSRTPRQLRRQRRTEWLRANVRPILWLLPLLAGLAVVAIGARSGCKGFHTSEIVP
jgi:hypothetical protein